MMRSLVFGASALALSGGAASAQAVYVAPYGAPAYVAPVPPVVFAPAPVYVAPYVAPQVAVPPYYAAPIAPVYGGTVTVGDDWYGDGWYYR
jgi:hypothetical protein